jgi:hypothetical protein
LPPKIARRKSFDGFQGGKLKSGFSGRADANNFKSENFFKNSPTIEDFGNYGFDNGGMNQWAKNDAK